MVAKNQKNKEQDIDLYIGKRLRRRRRLLGLTQQTLAEAVGIRFQQIQKYECGANRVSAARLFKLSEALSVPIPYFYEGLSADFGDAVAADADLDLTKHECDLVRHYRAAATPGKTHLLGIAKALSPDTDDQGGPQDGTSLG